ncbi:MAG: hypothetical protein QOG46_1152 [Pseudonocardiales bacterium]|nr:hypothetical protein [Pseudonocardiales bacterium]
MGAATRLLAIPITECVRELTSQSSRWCCSVMTLDSGVVWRNVSFRQGLVAAAPPGVRCLAKLAEQFAEQ